MRQAGGRQDLAGTGSDATPRPDRRSASFTGPGRRARWCSGSTLKRARVAFTLFEVPFKARDPWAKGLPRILDTLEALGRARQTAEGAWQGL